MPLTTVGKDIFLAGQLPDQVASVTVTYSDGTSQAAKTADGFALYVVPPAKLTRHGTIVALRGYNSAGKQIAARGLRIRQPRQAKP